MDPDDIYFPEAEDIGPHAIAFARLMFAHSEFEREVRSLPLQAAVPRVLSGIHLLAGRDGTAWLGM